MAVKLFVGGLSFSTTNEGLMQAFARFGVVTSARVMTDRETGRSRGFAFVEMATEAEAERAIAGLNGTSLDGRMIRIDKAMPRGSGPVPRPAGFRSAPGGGPPRSGGPPRPGYGPGRAGGFGDRPAPPAMEEQRGAGRGGQRRGRKPERGGEQRPGKPAGGRPTKQRRSGDRGRRTWEDL